MFVCYNLTMGLDVDLCNKCQKFISKYENSLYQKDQQRSLPVTKFGWQHIFGIVSHGSQKDTDTAFTVFPVDHGHHCAAQYNPYIVSHLAADFNCSLPCINPYSHLTIPLSNPKLKPNMSSVRSCAHHFIIQRCQIGTGPTS